MLHTRNLETLEKLILWNAILKDDEVWEKLVGKALMESECIFSSK